MNPVVRSQASEGPGPQESGSLRTPREGAPRAVIVAVGDELLLGRTVDTNSAWLGERLAELGLPLVGILTVPDEEEAIRDAFSSALQRAPLVVVTGGLGPTPDDLTREVAADFAGLPLREDPELLAALERRFKARGYPELPPSNRKTAQVPEGGVVLPNSKGTAPGLLISVGEGVLVLLPGVPAEMKAIFQEELVPRLPDLFPRGLEPLAFRVIPTTGIPESLLTDRIQALLPSIPPPGNLAYLPGVTGVDLRLTVSASWSDGMGWLDRMEEVLAPVVADFRVPRDDGDVAAALVEAVAAERATLSVAESCTGGGVAARITDVPGASRVFHGGVVAYANHVKETFLGVDPHLLEHHGAVSREVALAMAKGVRTRWGTDYGLGVTGVAGPGGGSPEKPVGTVWVAVWSSHGGRAELHRFPGDRGSVRARTAQAMLFLAWKAVVNGGKTEGYWEFDSLDSAAQEK
ncbi:MAG: CinA family nicotinamide mononucleotide deamidase-related protein [Gemmatimonadota bacterium]